MTLQQTPAPARSDLRPATSATVGAARPYFRHGTALTVGALAWAAATAAVGVSPAVDDTAELLVFGLGSGLFQLGLLALLRALYLSQALGTGRLAPFFLRLEAGFVALAIGSTLADTFQLSDLDQPAWLMLDAFWPLSMLGMFAIGIRIAVAGRWSGPARYWPMVAESWVVVTLPTLNLFGYTAAAVVSTVHLCVGYGVLGQLVARKEQ